MQTCFQRIRYGMLHGILISFNLVYTGCKPGEPDPLRDLSADQVAVVQALNTVAIPLVDADPARDFAELAPLDTVLAKAQVVGMGEGTHGTREFFRMKDRLFRYLVQRHGHRTIVFEANFGRAVVVNRFIHGQNSNVSSATLAAKSMYFWTWSTDEVRELLQWMRDYNAGKPASQQLSFFGVDCQYGDDEFPLIREFLAKVNPASVSRIDSLANQYVPIGGPTTADKRQRYAQDVTALQAQFVANETQWVAVGGREDYEVARQAARILVQQQDLSSLSLISSAAYGAKRDQYMAENVQWLLTTMNVGKLSLWAHNYHISKVLFAQNNQPTMGGHLTQQLKDKYLTIGTSLTNGSFTVRNAAVANAPLTTLSVRTDAIKTSLNYLLGKAQYANFALNLNQPQQSALLTEWLSATHPTFETGAGYDESRSELYYDANSLKNRFDVLIHFRDTTPTQLLP